MALVVRKTHTLVALIATFINSFKRMVADGGAGGSVSGTSASTTATMVAQVQSAHVRYEAPIAADLTTIVATLDPVVNGALTIAAQPDVPRKLQVRIVDGDSSITAGTLTLVGVGARGQALNQVINLAGGTRTVTTDDAYATLTSATVASLAGAVSGDTIGIGPSNALGLPGSRTPTAGTYAVYKANVGNANETVGTVDATAGTIVPTTAPNGSRTYDFWYNTTFTATQNGHTHGAGSYAGAPASSTVHYDRGEWTVSTTNASTTDTAVALCQALMQAYVNHIADALAHDAVDATNTLAYTRAQVVDEASAILAANDLKAKYNAHLTQSGVHPNNDATNSTSASNATNGASLYTLLNELKTDFNAHLADGMSTPSWRAVDA